MSLRTIVEFNHDYLAELAHSGHISDELWRKLSESYGRENPNKLMFGIRILGQRHHSETLILKVE